MLTEDLKHLAPRSVLELANGFDPEDACEYYLSRIKEVDGLLVIVPRTHRQERHEQAGDSAEVY
jgi:hypothetical protein